MTAGARVLYLTKVFPYPPALAGDAVYSRGVIEAWSGVADLTVLCADSGGDRGACAPEPNWVVIGRERNGRAGSILSRFPLIAWKGASRDFRIHLNALLKRHDWDIIVLDNIGLAHALPRALEYRKENPAVRLIYVSHECEFNARAGKYAAYSLGLLKSLVAKLDLMKVRRWERSLVSKCDVVTVINVSDVEFFRSIDPKRKYLPLLPGYAGPIAPERTITAVIPRRLLIVGGRRSEQKQQVLLNWLAVGYGQITAAGIEMTVVGDITPGLRSQLLRSYPKVTILGFVDNLEGIIAQARAGLIVDTVGGGFKLRILSHVFQRLPILGLSSAIDGLPTEEGKGYLAAATLIELVDMVCDVIDDTDLLNRLHRRAFTDCRAEFSWRQRGMVLSTLTGNDASDSFL